jgi:hypothetical protein
MRLAPTATGIALFWTLALPVIAPDTSLGQDSQLWKIPRLGDHTFVPNSTIKEPFVVGYIRNATGAGTSSKIRLPLVVLPDSTVIGDIDASIAAVLIQFEFQYAMKDWVAALIRVDAAGRLGTNEQSLISEGVTGVIGYELGWMFRLLESRRDYLSLTVSMESNMAAVVNLLNWIDRIIEEGEISPDNRLIRKPDSLRGLLGLRYARGLSSLFGLNAAGNLGYGEKLGTRRDNGLSYNLGLGISCNPYRKTGVPLGAFLGYRLTNYADMGDDLSGASHQIDLRFSYTGFPDLNVAFDTHYMIVPVEGFTDNARFVSFEIALRYYY